MSDKILRIAARKAIKVLEKNGKAIEVLESVGKNDAYLEGKITEEEAAQWAVSEFDQIIVRLYTQASSSKLL